jgi:hypothetical protein
MKKLEKRMSFGELSLRRGGKCYGKERRRRYERAYCTPVGYNNYQR